MKHNILPGAELAQLAWVVNDIRSAQKFFRDLMGIKNFSSIDTIRSVDVKGTYYGAPGDFSSYTSQAWSGQYFIELIQPASGRSIFQDYINKNRAGGIQHIAYRVPIADFDKAVAELTSKGYPVISTFDTPIAKIFFFDTYRDLGIATELMGVTKEGDKIIRKWKGEPAL